jgi:hypothetical protein
MASSVAVAPCRVCERGTLSRRNVHRMSGPAVVIGYIFLVPSLFGIAFSILMFVLMIASAGRTQAPDGAAILGSGIFVVTGLIAFVGGLVGWLLVMKKNVLQCSNCQAVVNAA